MLEERRKMAMVLAVGCDQSAWTPVHRATTPIERAYTDSGISRIEMTGLSIGAVQSLSSVRLA
jgi:hypothetical protein